MFVLNLWMMAAYGTEDENGSNEHKLENTHWTKKRVVLHRQIVVFLMT